MTIRPRASRLAALLIAVLVAAPAALAGDGAEREVGGKLLDSLTRLLTRLDLSDGKKQQLKTALQAHQELVTALLTRELEARTVVRTAAERRTSDDAAVRDAATALGEVDRDLARERAAIYADIAALLNDDQRVKVLRFETTLADQITAREREQTLPADKIAASAKLTEDQKTKTTQLVSDSRSGVSSALGALANARETVMIAVYQPQPDQGLIDSAATAATAAYVKVALKRAQVWGTLAEILNDKQRNGFHDYSKGLDTEIVDRYEAGALLFLPLL